MKLSDKVTLSKQNDPGKDPHHESQAKPEAAAEEQTAAREEPEAGAETVQALTEKLEAKEKEAREHYDRLLRVSAEFENYKKRTTREMADFRKFATETLIKDLLPVVDNLERAVAAAGQEAAENRGLVEGVEMTLKEILRIFEKYSVSRIDAVGKPFDPTYHEAVMREVSDEHAENTVLMEMQPGYTMHDRLLRPSLVTVSMPKAPEEP